MNEYRTIRPGSLRLVTDVAGGDPRLPVVLDGAAAAQPGRADASIRVLIADGHALVRAAYSALLERDERIEVVGVAFSGQQALALLAETAPDVALLDLALSGLDDLEAAAAFARVAVIVIAPYESDDLVFSALRAGAVGVLPKDAEPRELIRAVHLLAAGQALLPAAAVRRLLRERPPQSLLRRPSADRLGELTDRERQMVALVAKGLSNGEIAALLMISPATAKTHVSRAMIKLGARHRAQLVVLAYETGLVLPGRDASIPA